MPQLLQPGIRGPGTVDVLDGVIVVFEGISSQNADGKLGAAVNMPGFIGLPGQFADLTAAVAIAEARGGAFRGALPLVRYRPTALEAVKEALAEAERRGWEVTGIQIHPWFTEHQRHLLGAEIEEILAMVL